MSPLVWDLGHIAAYEDLWLAHRHRGPPDAAPDLAEVYDAFETPRAVGASCRCWPEARQYMDAVRGRTLDVLDRRFGDGIHEMVLRHEHQHNETMLQTLRLARLAAYRRGDPVARRRRHWRWPQAAWKRWRFPAARSPWARAAMASPSTTSARGTRPMSAAT